MVSRAYKQRPDPCGRWRMSLFFFVRKVNPCLRENSRSGKKKQYREGGKKLQYCISCVVFSRKNNRGRKKRHGPLHEGAGMFIRIRRLVFSRTSGPGIQKGRCTTKSHVVNDVTQDLRKTLWFFSGRRVGFLLVYFMKDFSVCRFPFYYFGITRGCSVPGLPLFLFILYSIQKFVENQRRLSSF